MRRLSLFTGIFTSALLIFAASAAQADNTVKITKVLRASASDITDAATIPIVYGGIQGTDTCTADGSVCNNCTTADQSCNKKRIYDGLKLRIEFRVEAEIEGQVYLGFQTDGAVADYTDYNDISSGTLSQGDTGFIEVDWGDLCDLANSGSTAGNSFAGCSFTEGTVGDNIRLHIHIGDTNVFDKDTTIVEVKIMAQTGAAQSDTLDGTDDGSQRAGIYDFHAKPGDKKVFIDDLAVNGSCPTEYKYARVFYSTTYAGGIAAATYTSESKDLKLGTDCEPKGEWYVDDLSNDTIYAFRIAIVDVAGNAAFLSDAVNLEATYAACDNLASEADFINADPACFVVATPGKVIGLLPEDFNCFIATAAYGSIFDKKVDMLRDFRNEFLLTNKWGTRFVKAYYQFGPKAAAVIREKPALRFVSQILLAPIVGMAWLALHYGLFGTLIVIICSVFLFVAGVRQYRRGEL